MKLAMSALCLLMMTAPAFADSQYMELYPKGRAAYQAKFDANAERYEIDKRSFIDNLYQYKAEGGASATTREKMLPEADLDAYINGTATLNEVNAAAPTKAPPLPSSAK